MQHRGRVRGFGLGRGINMPGIVDTRVRNRKKKSKKERKSGKGV